VGDQPPYILGRVDREWFGVFHIIRMKEVVA